ncbi:unnamed protein product [Jaminaea pallidilutea]
MAAASSSSTLLQGGESLATDLHLPLLSSSSQQFLRTSPPLALPPATSSCNLLDVSERYGLLAVATAAEPEGRATGFVVHQVQDLRRRLRSSEKGSKPELSDPWRRVTVPGIGESSIQSLRFAQNQDCLLAGLSDGRVVVWKVGELSSGKTEPSATVASPQPSSPLLVLLPNPSSFPSLVLLLLQSGAAHLLDLSTNSIRPFDVNLGATITAASWSVKGKQLAVGLSDGSLAQVSPEDNSVKARLPRPQSDELAAEAVVSDLFWIENDVFIVGYNAAPMADADDEPPHEDMLFALTRSKDGSLTHTALGDPSPAFGLTQLRSRRYAAHLKGWPPYKNQVFLASSPSTDVGLVARKDEAWETLELEETSRPTLPFSSLDKNADTAPLGMALDRCLPRDASEDEEEKAFDPQAGARGEDENTKLPYVPPTLWVFDSDGTLGAWNILVTDPAGSGGYPEMTRVESLEATSSSTEAVPTQASAAAAAAPAPAPAPTPPTSGFGGFAQSSTPQTGASAFGSPSAFGAKPSPSQSSGGGFGQASAFGQTSSAFGSGGSAFGQANQPSPSAFGAAAPSAFGASGSQGSGGFAGFGQPSAFGSSSSTNTSTGGAFGQKSAFGQPAGSPSTGTGGGFGQSSAFGGPAKPSSGFGGTSAFGQASSPSTSFSKPAGGGGFGGFGSPGGGGFGGFAKKDGQTSGSSIFGGGSTSTSSPAPTAGGASAFGSFSSGGAGFGGTGSGTSAGGGSIFGSGGSLTPSAGASSTPFGQAVKAKPPTQENPAEKEPDDEPTSSGGSFGFGGLGNMLDDKTSKAATPQAEPSSAPQESASQSPFSFASASKPQSAFGFGTPTAQPSQEQAKVPQEQAASSAKPQSAFGSFSATPKPTFSFAQQSSPASSPSSQVKSALGFASSQAPQKAASPSSPATPLESGSKLSTPTAAPPKTAFSFGDTKSDKPAAAEAPASSSDTKSDSNEGHSKATPPAFSFAPKPQADSAATKAGTPSDGQAASKPAPFSFAGSGSGASGSTNTFSFGAAAEQKQDANSGETKSAASQEPPSTVASDSKPAPTFSFAPKPDQPQAATEKPAFSFGQKPAEAPKSPAPSAAAASPEPQLQSTTNKSPFNFGRPAPNDRASQHQEASVQQPSEPNAGFGGSSSSGFSGFAQQQQTSAPGRSSPLSGKPFSFSDLSQSPDKSQKPTSTFSEASKPPPAFGGFGPGHGAGGGFAGFGSTSKTQSPSTEVSSAAKQPFSFGRSPQAPSAATSQPPEKAGVAPAASPNLPSAVVSAPSINTDANSRKRIPATPPTLNGSARDETSDKVAEQGLQGEFVRVFLLMEKELATLKSNIEQCASFQAQLRDATGVGSALDLDNPLAWSFGDLNVLLKLEKELHGSMKQARDGAESKVKEAKDLESQMLKAEAKREEAARLLRARSDPEFAKLVRVRQLGPEHAQNQTKLRDLSLAVRERIGETERYISELHARVKDGQLGKSHLKTPSLDSIQRTVRNISLSATTKSLELDDLLTEFELLKRSTRAGSQNFSRTMRTTRSVSVLSQDEDASQTPLPALGALGGALPSVKPPARRPQTDAVDAAVQAQKLSARLVPALLSARKEPILNRSAARNYDDTRTDRGAREKSAFSANDLQINLAKGPIQIAANRPAPARSTKPAQPQEHPKQAIQQASATQQPSASSPFVPTKLSTPASHDKSHATAFAKSSVTPREEDFSASSRVATPSSALASSPATQAKADFSLSAPKSFSFGAPKSTSTAQHAASSSATPATTGSTSTRSDLPNVSPSVPTKLAPAPANGVPAPFDQGKKTDQVPAPSSSSPFTSTKLSGFSMPTALSSPSSDFSLPPQNTFNPGAGLLSGASPRRETGRKQSGAAVPLQIPPTNGAGATSSQGERSDNAKSASPTPAPSNFFAAPAATKEAATTASKETDKAKTAFSFGPPPTTNSSGFASNFFREASPSSTKESATSTADKKEDDKSSTSSAFKGFNFASSSASADAEPTAKPSSSTASQFSFAPQTAGSKASDEKQQGLAKQSGFSFASQQTQSSTPAFSFAPQAEHGTKTTGDKMGKDAEAKSSPFSFAQTPSKATPSPALSSAAKPEISQSGDKLGQGKEEQVKPSTAAPFSFANFKPASSNESTTPTSTPAKAAAPTFSFGKAAEAGSTTPTASPAKAAPPPFSFGNPATAAVAGPPSSHDKGTPLDAKPASTDKGPSPKSPAPFSFDNFAKGGSTTPTSSPFKGPLAEASTDKATASPTSAFSGFDKGFGAAKDVAKKDDAQSVFGNQAPNRNSSSPLAKSSSSSLAAPSVGALGGQDSSADNSSDRPEKSADASDEEDDEVNVESNAVGSDNEEDAADHDVEESGSDAQRDASDDADDQDEGEGEDAQAEAEAEAEEPTAESGEDAEGENVAGEEEQDEETEQRSGGEEERDDGNEGEDEEGEDEEAEADEDADADEEEEEAADNEGEHADDSEEDEADEDGAEEAEDHEEVEDEGEDGQNGGVDDEDEDEGLPDFDDEEEEEGLSAVEEEDEDE